MSWLVILAGFLLLLRPLPTLLLPPARTVSSFMEVLETFVDQARSGEAIPFALQEALNVDFIATAELAAFITKKYDDPLGHQFGLMWGSLSRRGSGIVDGAAALAEMARARVAQDEELRAKTSGARTTFRLLVLLPAWFLLVGQLVGLPALSILVSRPWGYGLIGIAAALMWLGHRWMERILAAV